MSARRVGVWICPIVALVSVFACIGLAISKSAGLTEVRVRTAAQAPTTTTGILDKLKSQYLVEDKKDYSVVLKLRNGRDVKLGVKTDATLSDWTTWELSNPVSTLDVLTVELRERAMLGTKPVVEVPLVMDRTTSAGYEFHYVAERSFGVGLEAFFATPIGKAICAAFLIAIVIFLLSILSPG